MACNTRKLSEIVTSCGSNIPSIKKMWIGGYDTVLHPSGITYKNTTETDEDGNPIIESIQNITRRTSEGQSDPVYPWVEFQFRKNTCSASSEMTVNDNGTHYFTNALNMVLAKQDTNKRLNIEAIASGDCMCIYLDGNNNYWVIGTDQPVNMTTVSATTGTAATDSNQYELVLSEDAPSMPIQLVGDPDATTPVTPESIITALCAA